MTDAAILELKSKVERLWAAIHSAESRTERNALRQEYRRVMATYRRQLLMAKEPAEAAAPAAPEHEELPCEDGERPCVFKYHDYQDLLLAWFRYLKSVRGASIREFTKRSGVSAGILTQVLKRKGSLDRDDLKRMMPCLAMTAGEKTFLELLHTLSVSTSRLERLRAIERIQALPAYRKANRADHEAWRYLTRWYYVAIRELVTQPGFREDPDWIRRRLRRPVATSEINRALRFLEGAGLIRRNASGDLEVSQKQVSCWGGIYGIALGQFHKQMLELASDAIDYTPTQERYLTGHTMAVPAERLAEAFRVLDEAVAKIERLGQGNGANGDIFHFEFTAIPLTRAAESV